MVVYSWYTDIHNHSQGESDYPEALCVICCQDRNKSYEEYFADEDRPAGKAEGTCHLCWGPEQIDTCYTPFPVICFPHDQEGEEDE